MCLSLFFRGSSGEDRSRAGGWLAWINRYGRGLSVVSCLSRGFVIFELSRALDSDEEGAVGGKSVELSSFSIRSWSWMIVNRVSQLDQDVIKYFVIFSLHDTIN